MAMKTSIASPGAVRSLGSEGKTYWGIQYCMFRWRMTSSTAPAAASPSPATLTSAHQTYATIGSFGHPGACGSQECTLHGRALRMTLKAYATLERAVGSDAVNSGCMGDGKMQEGPVGAVVWQRTFWGDARKHRPVLTGVQGGAPWWEVHGGPARAPAGGPSRRGLSEEAHASGARTACRIPPPTRREVQSEGDLD